MIARLTGRVGGIEDGRCIVDVNGVGYLVHASTRSLAAFPAPPALATVLVETQVREDAIILYGFADTAERDWFRLLTTVQGVGAKVALSVLSTLAPGDLVAALGAADVGALSRAPGVGRKLAARIAAELREKAGGMPSDGGIGVSAVAPAATPMGDAVSALVNLGYRRPEAEAVVGRVAGRLGEAAAFDALIRDSLKELAR